MKRGVSGRVCTVFGLLLVMETGCGRGGGLVGHWRGTWTSPDVAGGKREAAVLTYNSDGTATSEMDTPFGQANASMTYRLDGDTLTQIMSSGTLAGRDIPLTEPPPPEVYRYWLDGDALTLTRTDTPTRISLRRVAR